MKSFVTLAIFCLAGISSASPSPALKPVVDSIEGTGRITRGSDAQPGQFPYQVGLSLRKSLFLSAWCGGSLISNTFVLTAAHCTDGIKSTTVYLGSTNRNAPELKRSVKKENIFVHPDWDSSLVKNDIALIKIDPVEFSKTINKVAIPAKTAENDSYADETAIASGWGRFSDRSEDSAEKLQYGFMDIINNRSCYSLYGFPVTSKTICVSTYGGSSTCNGDSGGPLVLKSSKVQIGLTSFGPADGCENGYPVVFTRVASYLNWIEKVSGVSY